MNVIVLIIAVCQIPSKCGLLEYTQACKAGTAIIPIL